MSYKKTVFVEGKIPIDLDKAFAFSRKIDYINGCFKVADDNFDILDKKTEHLEKRIKKHTILYSILTGLLILCIIIISSKLIEINDTLDKQLEVNEYLLNRVEFREVVEYGEFEESEEIS